MPKEEWRRKVKKIIDKMNSEWRNRTDPPLTGWDDPRLVGNPKEDPPPMGWRRYHTEEEWQEKYTDHLEEISKEDFEGWVQERGLYFADNWDEKYTPLFSWADKGEDPVLGGLITCQHGKGQFVYTGISFFRELPNGVLGAYRLFANLLSYQP